MSKLVLATRNKHKIEEIKTILGDLPLEILTLSDFPDCPPLVEDGATMEENSLMKALAVHRFTTLPSLADDSGLEVFYLRGRPGVRSARYAGENATDEENNEKLLKEMRGVAPRRRSAQFRAVLTLAGEGFQEITEGVCRGRLAESPRGTNGFGYDPIFLPEEFVRTYAELSSEEKNKISHRAKALEKMRRVLKGLAMTLSSPIRNPA
ncbi:MAG: XTP/dITP diphosphatase [Bacteroidota bacterium]